MSEPSTNDTIATMISDLCHTGELSMLYRCAIGDTIATLTAERDKLRAAGNAQTQIIRDAQAVLTSYLIPDGIDGPEAIDQLLGLLDGPKQRAAQSAWDAVGGKENGS